MPLETESPPERAVPYPLRPHVRQIAVGQARVGELEKPILYALTSTGDIYWWDTSGAVDEWKKLPPIPEVTQ